MKEIIRKVRRLELKIRKLVDTTFAGEYLSAFKGQGLEFDEVRPYQYGDDIRSIDWNVTAKTGQVYIKQFREEREQVLFVLFDVSGSEDFGPTGENKRLIGMEIASLLAFSALKNNDKIGMVTFSDRIEKYYKPEKGRKHILKIVRGVLTQTSKSMGTDLAHALDFVRHTLKRRSILLIISDFIDDQYESALIQLSHRHEVILIRLFHPNEVSPVRAGIIPVMDIESGTMGWINAADTQYREQIARAFADLDQRLEALSKRYDIGYIPVSTQADYLQPLERYFKMRNHQRKQHR
ncbi:MAG: DUF58 domain-containing protein [Bacteroidia bacterium]|nr:DUF58 domain-containing protein [Bacteroidia bacterium]